MKGSSPSMCDWSGTVSKLDGEPTAFQSKLGVGGSLAKAFSSLGIKGEKRKKAIRNHHRSSLKMALTPQWSANWHKLGSDQPPLVHLETPSDSRSSTDYVSSMMYFHSAHHTRLTTLPESNFKISDSPTRHLLTNACEQIILVCCFQTP